MRLLRFLGPILAVEHPKPGFEAARAALNGVLGDHLGETAIRWRFPCACAMMASRCHLQRESLTAALDLLSGRLAVLVHGLCLNDKQWHRDGHDHGTALARDLGYTAVYLHYNTGLHISVNGQAFADLLQSLVSEWPVPLKELVIIGHSMGGLVARSACHFGAAAGHNWPRHLRKLIFLGTPHHGAPMERGGQWLHLALNKSRYTAAFAHLGRVRSAGITDLRYGNLLDGDWLGRDRFEHAGMPGRPSRFRRASRASRLLQPQGARPAACAAAFWVTASCRSGARLASMMNRIAPYPSLSASNGSDAACIISTCSAGRTSMSR